MLISFRFKNFRSFPDETFIDMRAVSYKELPNHLVTADGKKLIKTLAVYGANASGKSNLFLALASFHSLIYRSLFSLRTITENHFMTLLEISNINKIVPFVQNEMNLQPTEMELTFTSGGRVFEYGYTIFDNKILAEHLAADHHMVFSRTADELNIGRLYEKSLRHKAGLRPNEDRLFCSILSCLDIPEIKTLMEPFKNFFSGQIIYNIDIFEPLHILGNSVIEGPLIHKITENPDALNYSLKQVRKFGIPLEDLIIEQGVPKLGYLIKSRSTGQTQKHYMDITKISTGTLKYLNLFVKFFNLSKTGGILIIDDISNQFHPVVTKHIIDSFQQIKNKNVQLIFTTHDISILNNQQFRRDEVAFVDINEYQESKLYTLADIKVRSDASFSKDYLLGKYGAIPLVKDNLF